jgi:hypothetical protein
MKKMLNLTLLIILVLQISACGIKTTAGDLPETNPIAWLDAPLDRQNIPFAPYEIIFHISDSIHMQAGEISINGEVIVTVDVPKPDNLSVIRYLWTPSESGGTTISVRGKNVSGEWSEPAKALIYVGELEPTETSTPTQTPTPEFTNTPTFTATATSTPTATPMVTPTSGPAPITFNNPHVNTNLIYWSSIGDGTCGREEVDFYVTIPPAAEVNIVKVRYRVIDLSGYSPPSEWGEKQMYLNNAYNGEWLVSVKSYDMVSGYALNDLGRVEYYFVAIRTADNETESSSVRDDVELKYCLQ